MKDFTFSESNPPVLVEIVVKSHATDCQFPETKNRKHCQCPKYFYVNPGRLRISAKTENWEEAKKRGDAWIRDHDPRIKRPKFTPKPIAEAFEDFITSRSGANLEESTLRKLRTLRDGLVEFVADWNKKHVADKQLRYLHEIKVEHLKAFAKTWDDNMPMRKVHKRHCDRKPSCGCREIKEPMSGASKEKRRGYLRQMFDHAIHAEWIANTGETLPKGDRQISKDNPANFLQVSGKAPRADQKMPLSDKLWAALLDAIDTYVDSRESINSDPALAERAKTFFTLMKTTGFAITDAFIAKKDRLGRNEEGYFFDLNRKKTGNPVLLPISNDFYQRLMNVPAGMKPTHPNYIFWSGPDARESQRAIGEQESNAADTMAKLWVKLMRLISPALLEKELRHDEHGALIMPTPHCLRYNFAETFLENGGTIELLADALGDTTAVVEKHYKKFSPKRQASLAKVVKAAWGKSDDEFLQRVGVSRA